MSRLTNGRKYEVGIQGAIRLIRTGNIVPANRRLAEITPLDPRSRQFPASRPAGHCLQAGNNDRTVDLLTRSLAGDVPFGIDFDVIPDGRLLYFEANVAMKLMSSLPFTHPDVPLHPQEAENAFLSVFDRYLERLKHGMDPGPIRNVRRQEAHRASAHSRS